MATVLNRLRQFIIRPKAASPAPAAAPEKAPLAACIHPLDIVPHDPALPIFLGAAGPVDIDTLNLDSPTVRDLKAAGVKLAVPLVGQGELIGLLGLGPRLSEQEYSADDRALLAQLATQAAPALRVAQLVRQQQAEAQERERLEQEMRVARLIQQTLLPKELPALAGWNLAAYYRPARAVGGDFYDFLCLPDGRLGIVVGDVTDKGVPAALVMATTRSLLRTTALDGAPPGRVLETVNDRLCPDIPPKMFVTCLYAILDPATGHLRYANAGHDLPYRRNAGEVHELRATGMPLGLMPGMAYEERDAALAPEDTVLFYSDGLVEAHDPERRMLGFPRLMALMQAHAGGPALIDYLLDELARFTGPTWEQEDDVTMVRLQRTSPPTPVAPSPLSQRSALGEGGKGGEAWRTLSEFAVASEPGNERAAMRQVAAIAAGLHLPAPKLERLKTAVAEATMNAIEHGNRNRAEVPVDIAVRASGSAVAVSITDRGGGRPIPAPETPDLDAKLAGQQTPRGWGLFLIEKMVDSMRVTADDEHHTVELIMFREENSP